MAEGAESSRLWCYLRRLNFTPMRDLLRGSITARFDFYRQLQEVFPKPLAKHMHKIVQRTRLDLREQALVTQELIRRFGKHVNGMRSTECMVTRINSKIAVRSLRRRYRRQRGRIRRTFDKSMIALAWSPVVFIGFYFCAMVFFWFSKPTPSVDYFARLNGPALAAPEEKHAWPLYREAALSLDIHSKHTDDLFFYGRTPTHPMWEDTAAFLRDHALELSLIERAADKPVFGVLIAYEDYYRGDDAMALYGPDHENPTLPDIPDDDPWGEAGRTLYFHGRVPGFLCMRSLAQVTSSDAYLAIEDGDANRFCDRIETLLRIAEHRSQLRCIWGAETANGTRYMAYETLVDALATQPAVLSDAHLEKLRALLEGQAGKTLVDTEGIHLIMMDLVQNAYTHDTLVGGWMTPEGTWLFHGHHRDVPPPHTSILQRLKCTAFTPIVACVMPSRHSMVDQIETRLRRFDEELAMPLYELPDEPRGIENFCGVLPFWYYMSPDTLMYHTGIRRMFAINDALRIGCLFGIEAEQYRRQHGDWPSRLEDLPSAAIYVDPITGKPARYRIRDGQLVLYSVGSDRDDDEGRLPLTHPYQGDPYENVYLAQHWNEEEPADGDWVIFPSPNTPLVYGRTVELPGEDDPFGYGYPMSPDTPEKVPPSEIHDDPYALEP